MADFPTKMPMTKPFGNRIPNRKASLLVRSGAVACNTPNPNLITTVVGTRGSSAGSRRVMDHAAHAIHQHGHAADQNHAEG